MAFLIVLVVLYFVVLLGYRQAYLKRLDEVREHEQREVSKN